MDASEVSGCLLLPRETSFKSTIIIACRTVILDAEMFMYIYGKMVGTYVEFEATSILL